MPKRRNVKSRSTITVDEHEKPKDFLTEPEVAQLLEAMRKSRYGIGDHLLLLLMYRHGFRVSEAIDVRMTDLNLKQSRIWVRRLKNGLGTEQPMEGDEIRAIKRYLRLRDSKHRWLFLSERADPMTRQNVNYLLRAAAERIAAPLLWVHPHTL